MSNRSYLSRLSQYGIVVFLVLLGAYFAYATDGVFLRPGNLDSVARQIAINTVLAVGLTFVIISGGIDLSVGSVLALAGVISMTVLRDGLVLGRTTVIPVLPVDSAIALSTAVALLVGAVLGAFNGLVITRFRVAPFVATLAMMTIARGLAYVYTDGSPVSRLPEKVRLFGSTTVAPWLPLPKLVFIALLVVVAGHFVLTRTNFGRYVYALGGNEEAARLSGVNIRRMKLMIYGLCGMLSGLGGMMLATRLASGDPKSGNMFELNAIAAAVLGGTSLMGGRGTIVGTLIGALVIGVLDNGLILLHVSSFYQMVAKGLVILGAVILDQVARRDG